MIKNEKNTIGHITQYIIIHKKEHKKSLLWVTDQYVELQNLSILSTLLYSHDAM